MNIPLPDLRQASVLVVGDVMLDRYWYGLSNRISPEAPVPIVTMNAIEDRPGGAANVAMNIAALGASPKLVGMTGVDDTAISLMKQLTAVNVICDFITVNTHPTITKLRVLSRNQQLIRIDFEKNFNNIDPGQMLKRIKQGLPQSGTLVLSDYTKGTLECAQEIITLARDVGVPVLVDPKGQDFSRYRGATLLTPNMLEFESIVGPCKNEKVLVNYGMKVISDYELSALLITRSEQGMTLLQANKEPLHFMTQAQDIYDVTGAGDTVIGVLASALSIGHGLEESCFLANVAAGVVVGKLGTATVSPIELENAIYGYSYNACCIMNESDLKQAVTLARLRGEKLVMTNGIFDILHAGHISYLNDARKLGDRLIVAVNSDSSTRRLKGDNRPVNRLEHRMIVLASLQSVDWVVPFYEDSPQRLIADVKPDILIKGGDYQPHEISGSKEVLDNGGDVQVLRFKHGFSTTNIINAIKNNQTHYIG